MAEIVKEALTEEATAESLNRTLDEYHIPFVKIIAIHLVEAQLMGGPGTGLRYKVLYRGKADKPPPAPPEPSPRASVQMPQGWAEPATGEASIA